MKPEEYELAIEQLRFCADVLAQHDWAAVQAAISKAETVGFLFMAPFAYMTGAKRTEALSGMVSAAQRLEAARLVFNEVLASTDAQARANR